MNDLSILSGARGALQAAVDAADKLHRQQATMARHGIDPTDPTRFHRLARAKVALTKESKAHLSNQANIAAKASDGKGDGDTLHLYTLHVGEKLGNGHPPGLWAPKVGFFRKEFRRDRAKSKSTGQKLKKGPPCQHGCKAAGHKCVTSYQVAIKRGCNVAWKRTLHEGVWSGRGRCGAEGELGGQESDERGEVREARPVGV